jgi:Predicted membrane protein
MVMLNALTTKDILEERIIIMENGIEFIWKDRKRNALGLPWTFTKYSLSEDRLFVESGLLKTVENEVRLYRILDLSLSRTLSQKIFGIGTIKVSSADKTLGDFEIKNIKKPDKVKEDLSRLVEENREKKRVSGREYMGEEEEME